ncbi:MAG TPA: DUF2071 domain-containing protein [Vicinamibacterales bacterium]|nr:DUF2071 domain-containing protein [Vicinamibacterales bacterium]
MRWLDLAFLHWPVTPDVLRPLIPESLQLDTYDGRAWLGVVPFRMEGVRLRGAPPVPTAHAFPEINVRTYVRSASRAGVWFFSLDATSRLAVRGARLLYNLPYFDAEITLTADAGAIRYESTRVHRGAPDARFVGRYRPVGDIYEAAPGTLDHFLVERYCLFMFDDRRGLGLLDIDHEPWPLQRASAEVSVNTMADPMGVGLPLVAPLVHFARALDVRAWTRTSVA